MEKGKNQKISESLKKHFAENGHHNSGKAGWTPTEEQKEIKRPRVKSKDLVMF